MKQGTHMLRRQLSEKKLSLGVSTKAWCLDFQKHGIDCYQDWNFES
jgi:hypothetical protein